MKEYIEQIIDDSLKRITNDIELLRNTVLVMLHQDIDILLDKSGEWFNNSIPDEYKKVIRSLVTITTTFLSKKIDYREMVFDAEIEKVDLLKVIHEVVEDFSVAFHIRGMTVHCEMDTCQIYSSSNILNKSLYNIMMSFIVFMDEHSSCDIEISRAHTSIIIDFKFTGLADNFPGIERIQKEFFPYREGTAFRVGIGINTALYNLKNIGTIVNVRYINEDRAPRVQLSFPSVEFIDLVDDIRKSDIVYDENRPKKGEVVLIIHDFVVEMILDDILKQKGYDISRFNISDLDHITDFHKYKAVVVDYNYIINNFINMKLFLSYMGSFKKIIIIYGDDDNIDMDAIQKPGVACFKKPVTVDSIIAYIEGH